MPRMKQTLLAAMAVMIVCAFAGTARAGGEAGSFGVGAEFQLSGLGGLSANYDAGKFHVGGFIGFADPDGQDDTTFDIGARFFFHVASTASADFSVGGGVGIESTHLPAGNPNTDTLLFLEPSFQIRAFVVPNVALSFTGGITIGTIDAAEVDIFGQVSVIAGVHYYF